MHIMLSDNEKQWVNMKKFGWKIKEGCPEKTKQAILRKIEIIKNQQIGVFLANDKILQRQKTA